MENSLEGPYWGNKHISKSTFRQLGQKFRMIINDKVVISVLEDPDRGAPIAAGWEWVAATSNDGGEASLPVTVRNGESEPGATDHFTLTIIVPENMLSGACLE